ncbi:MAG: hypothetical protein EZS28_034588 [Streblomastix strix]|uniref:Uncharacterized protein n=1 Tax=Streblomastix strix TaxID=222440 RepID=A0A5J4UJR4_9EUKA|nr:MAG: hypothetical protein EZS28_034588 [Streblomastix strix]
MQKVIRRLLQDEEVDDNDDHTQEGTLNTQEMASDEFGTIHKEKPTTVVDVNKEFDDIGKIGKDKQIQNQDNNNNNEEENEDDGFYQTKTQDENSILKLTQSNNQYNQTSSPSNPRIVDPKIASISMGQAVKFDLNSMMQNSQYQPVQQKQPYSASNSENSQSSSSNSSVVTGGTIGLGLGVPGFQQASPSIGTGGSENNSPQMLIVDFSKQPMTGIGSQIQMMPWFQQANLDEDEDEDKNKGLVRNLVTDQQWEEKLDHEIIKLQTAYKQLPSPTSLTYVFSLSGIVIAYA